MKLIRLTACLAAFLTVSTSVALAEMKHGIAMHGDPALPPDFKSFPYANAEAPQGGSLRQAVTGTFDSLNPFIVKGNAATGIRTYVFESLLARNWAEPFSLYGLLAEGIDVSEDRQVFTFKLRPNAKFSDGSPVTAADVVFSMETLRDKGRPNFKNAYSKVKKVETPDERTITFTQEAGDRELPLLIGNMAILSKKSWEGRNFDESTLQAVVGSGPYTIGDVKPGESITYKKNPDYWGKDISVVKGLWNFGTVRFDYYKDGNAAFEAFKKGDVDIRMESDPVRWSTGYEFPAVKDGKVVKEFINQKSPALASGLVFNTRRKIFEDVKVREALVMAFDFEWANANLFANSFKRTYGYFGGSELSSESESSYKLPVSDGSGRDRKMLRAVVGKLAEAGWKIDGDSMKNAAGEPLVFTISIQTPEQEKISLHYQRTLQSIGIKAEVRIVDAAQFESIKKTYDFDMIPWTYVNSLSPGNEQKLYYGSDGRKTEGTRNFPGVADPDVDAAIDALIKAKTREELVAAARTIDRKLVEGHYMVPFYDAGGQWVARWNYIGRPEQQPLPGFEATTLWRIQ
jgi:peptide/nickel transport system substrate-binding protein